MDENEGGVLEIKEITEKPADNGKSAVNDSKTVPPTAGEQIFAAVFTFIYMTLLVGIIGMIAVLIISSIFKGVSPGIGFLLVFVIFGLYPHAKKAVLESLCETRGVPALRRFGKAIASIHN
jgi:hypothetical protein